MKASEVLKILRISRPTLTKYVKKGLIQVTVLKNGRYDYDSESVYAFLNKDIKRRTVIYARVSTSKQKKDLQNQVELLKNYAFMNGIQIGGIYQDIASGISFSKRHQFFEMLDAILCGQVETVLIAYKDRLSRVGFELFNHLFNSFGCKIVVVSSVGSTQLDSQEIFEEIVSLLHCYCLKLYSQRKRKKIVERGLFRTSKGFKINADVNGALNILRKVIGDIFLKPFVEKVKKLVYKVVQLIPSRGYLCYPFKVCF